MENKYFTPAIEDIHIGYECEKYSIGLQMVNDRFLPDNERDDELKWRPNIIKCGSDILGLEAESYPNEDEVYKSFKTLWKDYIRVPYLTKEQIEAEGWEYKHTYKDPMYYDERIFFEKRKSDKKEDIWKLQLEYYKNNLVRIHIDQGHDWKRFLGECKDINTFRKITKLLNIN